MCVPALAMKWLVPFDIMAGVIVKAILFLKYQTHLCVQNWSSSCQIISIFVDYFVGSQAEGIDASFFSGKRKSFSIHFCEISPYQVCAFSRGYLRKIWNKMWKKFSTLKAFIWECREWYNCLTPFPPGWVRPSIKEQNLLTSFRHCRQVFHDYDDRDDGDDSDDDNEW